MGGVIGRRVCAPTKLLLPPRGGRTQRENPLAHKYLDGGGCVVLSPLFSSLLLPLSGYSLLDHVVQQVHLYMGWLRSRGRTIFRVWLQCLVENTALTDGTEICSRSHVSKQVIKASYSAEINLWGWSQLRHVARSPMWYVALTIGILYGSINAYTAMQYVVDRTL